MKKKEKTNVMRVLDSKKIKYNEYYYGDTEAVSGVDVAKALGQNPENVFKTLVTTGKSGEHYVFMVPVAEELDLKKAAKAVGADYAVDVYPHYGSDVEATLRSGADIRHGLIGAGVYASHGYERSHIDGVYNTLKLLCGYLNV